MRVHLFVVVVVSTTFDAVWPTNDGNVHAIAVAIGVHYLSTCAWRLDFTAAQLHG